MNILFWYHWCVINFSTKELILPYYIVALLLNDKLGNSNNRTYEDHHKTAKLSNSFNRILILPMTQFLSQYIRKIISYKHQIQIEITFRIHYQLKFNKLTEISNYHNYGEYFPFHDVEGRGIYFTLGIIFSNSATASHSIPFDSGIDWTFSSLIRNSLYQVCGSPFDSGISRSQCIPCRNWGLSRFIAISESMELISKCSRSRNRMTALIMRII